MSKFDKANENDSQVISRKRTERARRHLETHQESHSEKNEFAKRRFLSLKPPNEGGVPVSILTYNCLAQTLIRRENFPGSGDALKWRNRSLMLMNELAHYDSDILCLQEIDVVQYQQFWQDEMSKLNYTFQYCHYPNKTHGLLIAWKSTKFLAMSECDFRYDNEMAGGKLRQLTQTRNVGLLVRLGLRENRNIQLVVGTTHLFWHPQGTAERARQCLILIEKLTAFIGKGCHQPAHLTCIIAGDFNIEPSSVPYKILTQTPTEINLEMRESLLKSLEYNYSAERNEGMEINQDSPTFTNEEWITELIKLYKTTRMRFTSLYGLGYYLVDPECTGRESYSNEPEFSSWSPQWDGLLDYIFVAVQRHDSEMDLKHFETENNLQICGFLEMPRSRQMHHHSQPFIKEFPSDHLCMCCHLALLD